MWNDRLRLAERVEGDWQALTASERAEAMFALERIDENPICGAPLFDPLRGYWSLRSPGLRLIYTISQEARFVVIVAVRPVAASEHPSWR